MVDGCRKAFETKYRRLDLTRTYDGGYWKDEVRWRWEAWQAAWTASVADDAEALVRKLTTSAGYDHGRFGAYVSLETAIRVVREHFATPTAKEGT